MTIASLESKLQDVTSAGDDSDPDIESGTDAVGLLPLENERLAYGNNYTTDATPFQSRIGAQAQGVSYVFSAVLTSLIFVLTYVDRILQQEQSHNPSPA